MKKINLILCVALLSITGVKAEPTKDCFEGLNRATFKFNQVLDGAIFKPVASDYRLDFLNAAESYRRYFIKTLNDEYAFGGSKTGERGWKASNEFFRSIKDFSYKEADFLSILSKYLIDILCLLFWGMILVVGIVFFTRKELI